MAAPARDPLAIFGVGPLTMSSREIVDLVEARHNDVVETIERQFAKGVLRKSRNTPRPYAPPGGGRPTDVYDLTKRDTLVVVSGYDDALRAIASMPRAGTSRLCGGVVVGKTHPSGSA